MMRVLSLMVFLAFTGPGVASAQDRATAEAAAEPAVTLEARALMDSYAAVLRAGDRAGIADLYSRDGGWIFWEGQGGFNDHAAIARSYAEAWDPPAAFEWRDLVFVPTGPDTVTVTGRFEWTAPGEAPISAFYQGQFIRQDGRLRIQIEHEGRVPPR